MLADLALTCTRCGAPLDSSDRKLSMRTPDGLRHAYECDCEAITITVSADPEPARGTLPRRE
ncbi:MAG: hypothetical protein ACQEQJ_03120 [Halobacteriota archaeon]|nr:hypothetical protein [Halodesulfurarchaeum formicicum]AOW80563.1 hypothetical protein HTSR_1387 [Halodesulfurarchaeum formicicum]